MSSRILLASGACCALVLLAFSVPALEAGTSPSAAAAKKYFEFYQTGKVQELAPFLTEESVMEDATAAAMGMNLKVKGKEIIPKLAALYAAVENPRFTAKMQFVSGNHAVSAGTMEFANPAQVGADGKPLQVKLDVVTVLVMKGDKVLHHIDYADYDGMMRRMMGSEE